MKLILPFILIFSLGSCAITEIVAASTYKVEKGAFPENYAKNNEVLMIILFDENSGHNKMKYNNTIRRIADKFYLGRHEFVRESQVNNSKYSNPEKYRYEFRIRAVYRDGNMSTNYSGYYSNVLYLHDRKENKDYDTGLSSSFYHKLAKVYLKRLEKKRVWNVYGR